MCLHSSYEMEVEILLNNLDNAFSVAFHKPSGFPIVPTSFIERFENILLQISIRTVHSPFKDDGNNYFNGKYSILWRLIIKLPSNPVRQKTLFKLITFPPSSSLLFTWNNHNLKFASESHNIKLLRAGIMPINYDLHNKIHLSLMRKEKLLHDSARERWFDSLLRHLREMWNAKGVYEAFVYGSHGGSSVLRLHNV